MAISAARGIGVLGGTFDPVHHGHLRLAWEAFQHLALDHVRFVPCHVTPHRVQPATPSTDRLAMVRLACSNVTGFRVDDRELQRGEPSWSVETLSSLREELGPGTPLVFILGLDAFNAFSAWHRHEDILSLCHLWVAKRPGNSLPTADSREYGLLQELGTTDPALLRSRPAGHILVRDTVALDISATFLRHQYAQGLTPRFLLPDTVNDYILERGLYRSSPTHGDN